MHCSPASSWRNKLSILQLHRTTRTSIEPHLVSKAARVYESAAASGWIYPTASRVNRRIMKGRNGGAGRRRMRALAWGRPCCGIGGQGARNVTYDGLRSSDACFALRRDAFAPYSAGESIVRLAAGHFTKQQPQGQVPGEAQGTASVVKPRRRKSLPQLKIRQREDRTADLREGNRHKAAKE